MNVYATGAGFFLIRNPDLPNGESGFNKDADVKLPGPPPISGVNPNDEKERASIREIPLAIQDKSFYEDGSLFYPPNRAFFNNDGVASTCRADNSGLFGNADVYLPTCDTSSEDLEHCIPPVWNPEAFFDTFVVNGKTWPFLDVAQERYRFRLLNACDSRFISLYLKKCSGGGGGDCDMVCSDSSAKNWPLYVIGSELSLLPQVAKIEQGSYQTLDKNDITTCENGGTMGTFAAGGREGLTMGPGERYDIIIDFDGLNSGESLMLCNSGPDGPFRGNFATPPNSVTTAKVLKFVIDANLNKKKGDETSTICEINYALQSNLDSAPAAGGEKKFVSSEADITKTYTLIERLAGGEEFETPAAALIGDAQSNELLWTDPIDGSIGLNHVVDWKIDNRSEDARMLAVLYHRAKCFYTLNCCFNGSPLSSPLPLHRSHACSLGEVPGCETP